MRNILVPVLLLATAALSSSNVLPILSMSEFKTEPVRFDDHQNDNTISNKYNTRNNDVLFNIETQEPNFQNNYLEADNGIEDETFNSWKNNYDVKGFRKEQWHNYPRQLDRLNRQIYEDHDIDKRNLDPDDSNEDTIEAMPDKYFDIPNTNEMDDDILNSHNSETAASLINPLLILKIQLACLRKDKDYYQALDLNEIFKDNKVDDSVNEFNPKPDLSKVKREEKDESHTKREETKNRIIKKRIFSLWSRLQSLNHKGHELHHRRHLYTLYGPDSDGGGVLTAETRATFMRPPGSPLRWG